VCNLCNRIWYFDNTSPPFHWSSIHNRNVHHFT
jgi:hypothetical protein